MLQQHVGAVLMEARTKAVISAKVLEDIICNDREQEYFATQSSSSHSF